MIRVPLFCFLFIIAAVSVYAHSNPEWSLRSLSVNSAEITIVNEGTTVVSLAPMQAAPFRVQWVRNGGTSNITAVPWVGRHGESTVTVVSFGSKSIVTVATPHTTYISNLTTSSKGSLQALAGDGHAMPSCSTDDVPASGLAQWQEIATRKPSGDAAQRTFTIPLSIVLDWQGRRQFSSVEEATAYCTTVFATMQAHLATIPGTELVLANLRVWDTQDDPFPDEAVPDPPAVRAFTEPLGRIFATGALAGTPGAVHALWTDRSNLSVGGVASRIGGILSDSTSLLVAQIRRSSPLDAKISSHELGYVLGSAHTHSCLWPTGPIDSCWSAENGTCFDILVKSEGTITSYCGLPIVGGTIRQEFHPLTADIIRGYMMVDERLGGSEAEAERNCEIRGTVTFGGLPAANVALELVPISTPPNLMPESRRRAVATGSDGTYAFDSVAPGFYAVASTSTEWLREDNYEFRTVRILTEGSV
jgi:hypothetical protein